MAQVLVLFARPSSTTPSISSIFFIFLVFSFAGSCCLLLVIELDQRSAELQCPLVDFHGLPRYLDVVSLPRLSNSEYTILKDIV